MYARRVKVETSIRDRYEAVNVYLPFVKKKKDVNFIEGNVWKENVNIACSSDQLVSSLSNLLQMHGHDAVEYTEWEKQDAGLNKKGNRKTRVKMVKKKVSLNAMVIKLAEAVQTLAYHLFTARWQQQQFSEDWVVLNLKTLQKTIAAHLSLKFKQLTGDILK
jgi:hypothetical protein